MTNNTKTPQQQNDQQPENQVTAQTEQQHNPHGLFGTSSARKIAMASTVVAIINAIFTVFFILPFIVNVIHIVQTKKYREELKKPDNANKSESHILYSVIGILAAFCGVVPNIFALLTAFDALKRDGNQKKIKNETKKHEQNEANARHLKNPEPENVVKQEKEQLEEIGKKKESEKETDKKTEKSATGSPRSTAQPAEIVTDSSAAQTIQTQKTERPKK